MAKKSKAPPRKSDEDQKVRKARHSLLQRAAKRVDRWSTVVGRAMLARDWGQAEFARQLSLAAPPGREVSRQTVDGWLNRGVVPSEWIIIVHELTGVLIKDLLEAKPRVVDDSIVERAIRIVCPETVSAADFAARLSEVSGRSITSRMVSEWRNRERIPSEYAAWINKMTRIPLSQLLARDLVIK